MAYSSPSVTTYNPNENCSTCAGVGYVPIFKANWRTEYCIVCPICKGTGESKEDSEK